MRTHSSNFLTACGGREFDSPHKIFVYVFDLSSRWHYVALIPTKNPRIKFICFILDVDTKTPVPAGLNCR